MAAGERVTIQKLYCDKEQQVGQKIVLQEKENCIAIRDCIAI